jgi:hypothetical protein
MKTRFAIIGALVMLWSCNPDTKDEGEQQSGVGQKDTAITTQPVVALDTIFLTDEFGPFQDALIQKALAELLICDVYVDTVEKLILPCRPDLFRAFQLGPEIPFKDGMIVDVKPGVIPGSTTRKFYTIIKGKNGWVTTNDLRGSLLEMRKTNTPYYDLIIRYANPKADGTVAVLHRWNEKEKAFLPLNVAEINNRIINPEFQDSLNQVYLKDFVWGY